MRALIATLTTVVVASCGGERSLSSAAASARAALVVDNGRQVNGRSVNGRSVNGRDVNGRNVNGRNVDGVRLAGGKMHGLALQRLFIDGSELVAVRADGTLARGDEVVGLELIGETATGPLRLTIAGVSTDDGQPDLYRYDVTAYERWGEEPLCEGEEGQRAAAIALRGTWDERTGDHRDDEDRFTFACHGFVLAKCAEMGYAPWRSAERCVSARCLRESLASAHQACTRLLRADYCGDGRAWTRDGLLINVYDAYGIQVDTEPWAAEAEWLPEGARCLSEARWKRGAIPVCGRRLEDPSCGDPANLAAGLSLLVTEKP